MFLTWRAVAVALAGCVALVVAPGWVTFVLWLALTVLVVALDVALAAATSTLHWTRSDIRHYLWMHSGNRFEAISRGHRYGTVYNRNLPKWYKRDPDSRIPIVPGPENIHLFVLGGQAGRFSAFIPGWGHMNTPVLRPVLEGAAAPDGPDCADGVCPV